MGSGVSETTVNLCLLRKFYPKPFYFLLSASMPRKCLATTRCIVGTMACRLAKIASNNQIIDCRTRVVFKASPMIPIAAKRKLRTVLTLPAIAHLLISAITCSRLLKGWSCNMLAILDITPFRFLNIDEVCLFGSAITFPQNHNWLKRTDRSMFY